MLEKDHIRLLDELIKRRKSLRDHMDRELIFGISNGDLMDMTLNAWAILGGGTLAKGVGAAGSGAAWKSGDFVKDEYNKIKELHQSILSDLIKLKNAFESPGSLADEEMEGIHGRLRSHLFHDDYNKLMKAFDQYRAFIRRHLNENPTRSGRINETSPRDQRSGFAETPEPRTPFASSDWNEAANAEAHEIERKAFTPSINFDPRDQHSGFSVTPRTATPLPHPGQTENAYLDALSDELNTPSPSIDFDPRDRHSGYAVSPMEKTPPTPRPYAVPRPKPRVERPLNRAMEPTGEVLPRPRAKPRVPSREQMPRRSRFRQQELHLAGASPTTLAAQPADSTNGRRRLLMARALLGEFGI